VGLLLICLSILLGYIAEKSISFIFKHVKTWAILILLIFMGYGCIGLSTQYLIDNSPDVPKVSFSDMVKRLSRN
jgi:hypothetical protein